MSSVDKVNNASYYLRLQQMQMERAQTGGFNDLRDNPMFTAEGRAAQAQAIWEQMGGPGSFIQAKYAAQANQSQLNMASIKDTIDGVGKLAKTVMEIVGSFKQK